MRLATPQSAILSAVIFNALIIIALDPAGAPKGVRYRPIGAAAVLRRYLWIYGVGGIILPFPGIKLIDMILVALGWRRAELHSTARSRSHMELRCSTSAPSLVSWSCSPWSRAWPTRSS